MGSRTRRRATLHFTTSSSAACPVWPRSCASRARSDRRSPARSTARVLPDRGRCGDDRAALAPDTLLPRSRIMDETSRIAARLRQFGETEAPTSPLYQRLAPLAADRPSLLRLLQDRLPGQPPANVLLAAVQRRLMDRPDAALRAYYPTLGGSLAPDAALEAAFDAFWPAEHAALAELIRTRRSATNEVRRAAVLRLGYVVLARRLVAMGLPPSAHLVEIGASAGLTLLWDRFAYRYGETTFGPPDAALTLVSAWRSPDPPPATAPFTPAGRIGLDLAPPSVHDPDAMAWLRALIWPEHVERARLFDQALALARRHPPPVEAVDALAWLPAGLDTLPERLPAVVVHAFTVNQFSTSMRHQLDQALAEAAALRPVFRLGYEWTGTPAAALTLTTYPGGRTTTLATADAHGAWIEPRERFMAEG
ncbi:MAG: DUF2332 domain-containing protein [Geminicoccaceae bacterium]|nr:MAG: DUF2332 domain-containing protein [Geminicoccaceae bacterium]